MNAKDVCDAMSLVAYHLAEAETFERKAAAHRKTAMSIQGAAHCEFKEAMEAAKLQKKESIQQ